MISPFFKPNFDFFLLLTSLMAIIFQSNGCDLFRGKRVIGDSYPLYNVSDCLFITPPWNCQSNGRSYKMNSKYKWQPSNCSFVRFDSMDFLKRSCSLETRSVGTCGSPWHAWFTTVYPKLDTRPSQIGLNYHIHC